MKSAQSGPEAVVERPRRILGVLATLLLSWAAAPVRGEVSVVTDSHGRYLRTLVISESRGGQHLYWSPLRRGVDRRFLLNPSGDWMSDSAPVVAEQPGTRQPWVIWSATDGHDREIAFATWSRGRWQGPGLLERTDNPYDELNPRLAFDLQGRPVVTWWRNEPVPRIYLSIYRDGTWSVPLPVSDASTPSRYPSLRLQGSRAVLTFFTPRGQTVLYQELSQVPVQMESNGPLDGPVPPPDAHQEPGGGDESGNGVWNCSPNCPEINPQRPQGADDQ